MFNAAIAASTEKANAVYTFAILDVVPGKMDDFAALLTAGAANLPIAASGRLGTPPIPYRSSGRMYRAAERCLEMKRHFSFTTNSISEKALPPEPDAVLAWCRAALAAKPA